ncbi:MAG: 1-acyl-sn-glycerol-3-phosphate acyltransferase [Clostridiales Family XIII bacterium]|jgi:1-acyl-sn-glycerol-3-phosphate acyltransferase|nr:1-acyl-sn-glycerol-3-phosphate acyltransferase [Clostridiales Family XIII bacterium]
MGNKTVRPGRSIDTTPFDRHREPPRQNLFLMPLIHLACFVLTRGCGLRVKRRRMRGLKPPFLVLATHHAFMDFYVTPLALFPHRANYVSELEGFENFGEWIYRQIGCLGTRKFIHDFALIRNIHRVIERGDILVLYPEARYANVGTSSKLDISVAKLAKRLGAPVVTLQMRGNYLQSPIWNLKKRMGVRLEAEIEQVFTRDELCEAAASEILERLQEKLSYDEYAYQYDSGMAINAPWRAEGLDAVLYRCPSCNRDFTMRSRGARLFCEACGSAWTMTELGRLCPDRQSGVEEAAAEPLGSLKTLASGEVHIPDWYEWQRATVEREIDAGSYSLDCAVEIESLPNAKNFIALGCGRLRHDAGGFQLIFGSGVGSDAPRPLSFAPESTPSVHTEYDYRGKGQCITLSVPDDTFFIYPSGEEARSVFNVTKIQFAQEYIFSQSRRERGTR